MTAFFAWSIALALGFALWCLIDGRPRTIKDVLAAFGHAVPLGLLTCALAIRAPSALGFDTLPMSLWWWPAVLLVPLMLALWWQSRRQAPLSVPSPSAVHVAPALSFQGWLALLILGLIAIRAFWLYEEALLRPLFGWDAWLAWSVKAKAWTLSGQALPFVDAKTWLTEDAGATRTSLAYNYPELLSWLQMWLSSPSGGWSEPAVNVAWPTLWLALLAGCCGQWRSLSVSPLLAAIGVYLLASLPLANVHAALPGYADLWIATVFVFAVLAVLRWYELGQRSQLLLALVLTFMLPGLKLEGMVWATGVVALVLWLALADYGRITRVVAALACVIVLIALSWVLDLSWLNQVVTLFNGRGHDGRMVDVLTSTGAGLFMQDNWHLLWYLLPIVVIWRWQEMHRSSSLTGLLLLLAGGLSLLLILFVFTPAGRWAESFTAVNRLILHLAPIAITAMMLLLREPVSERKGAPVSDFSPASDTAR